MRGHIKKRVEMRRLKRTRRIGSEGRLSPFPKQQNEQQQQKQVLTPKVKQYFGKIKIVKLAKKNLGVATKFYTKGFDRVLQKNNMCKISLTQLQNKLLYFFSRLLVKYRERVKNVYEKFYECTEEDIAALSIEHRTYTAEELDQQAKEAQEAAEEEAEEERVRAAEELAEFKRKLNQTIQKQKYLLTHKEETSITVTPGADVKIVTANSSNGCTYNTSTSAKVDSVTADGSINLLPATSTQAAAISIASSDDTVLNAQDSSLFGEFADVLQQTCASTDMHTENDDNIGEIATELAMQEVAADAVNAVIGADCSEIYSATKIPFLQFFTTNVRFGNSDL